MQAFEQLRHLARWSGDGDPTELAIEAADGLASFADDPAGLVVACRQLLAHHPAAAELWWLAARLLGSAQPAREARIAAAELERDPTVDRLVEVLPFPMSGPVLVVDETRNVASRLRARPDLEVIEPGGAAEIRVAEVSHVLVDCVAVSTAGALVRSDPFGVSERARRAAERWAIAGSGRILPERLAGALATAATATEGLERVPLSAFAAVVGPEGRRRPEHAVSRPSCGTPPELVA